jgi:hypothetical protein
MLAQSILYCVCHTVGGPHCGPGWLSQPRIQLSRRLCAGDQRSTCGSAGYIAVPHTAIPMAIHGPYLILTLAIITRELRFATFLGDLQMFDTTTSIPKKVPGPANGDAAHSQAH